MTKHDFMRELAYLLQDIENEDKDEALQYYEDYFDEAGPERESQVIEEFGSPERIAAIIRADLAGQLEKGGEFTDQGYEDARFKDPLYQVATPVEDTAKQEQQTGSKDGFFQRRKQEAPHRSQDTKPRTFRTNRTLKLILWGILILIAAPILLGIGGGIFEISSGIFGISVMLLVLLAFLTLGTLLGGIILLPWGIISMFSSPLEGLGVAGAGLICLGAGALLLALSLLFYGIFLPFVIRSTANWLNRLFHKRR